MENGIMIQYFEWYTPADGTLWQQVTKNAPALAKAGFTALWLPPAYKGQAGANDVGYGVYDVYDLGEFNQKDTVRTKYGTKAQYLAAVKALHKAGIDVYADIVLNHKMGADATETVQAVEDSGSDRLQTVSGQESITAWTKFTFPGRAGKYSTFTWDHTCFDGVDYDDRTKRQSIYCFAGQSWDKDVDGENKNYDYLMGADIDFNNQSVLQELDTWGRWTLDTTGVDGFRLDAVKHIRFTFYRDWLNKLRADTGKELFAVGEYWSPNIDSLQRYLDESECVCSLFDVPLHFNFFKACNTGGAFDMRTIFDGTLVQRRPDKAVTFVENHDTQAGQALQTVIMDWFVPIAYSLILLRPQGYPCVFYGDYYGVPSHGAPAHQKELDILCHVRRAKVYGAQHDYFDHPDVIGWTMEGDDAHEDSGVAVLLTDGPAGEKTMYVGTHFAGRTFTDQMGGVAQPVVIGQDGNGLFTVNGGSVAVYTAEPLAKSTAQKPTAKKAAAKKPAAKAATKKPTAKAAAKKLAAKK